jgi:chitinase
VAGFEPEGRVLSLRQVWGRRLTTSGGTDVADIYTTTEGKIYSVDPAGADIVGFDPAHDKLDLGDFSVHNFIVVDTATGVGFLDPWSGDMIVVQGVSLGQLTIDSFMPVTNDHLRQCLSGALAWEQGITQAANIVYARSHELGQVDKVAFNPATDVVDFRFYGSREQISMTQGAEGVIISNAGTGQALILLGVELSELTVQNFLFYSAEVREDRVHLQLGFTTVPDSQVVSQGVPVAGTTNWPSGVGAGDPPSGVQGTTYDIDWDYGVAATIAFNPSIDKLNFGWFKASEFSIAEVNGSTVITIEGNKQTYTLTGVSLGELSMSNITALDTTARAEWQTTLDAAPDADPLPTLSVADAAVVEATGATAALVFTVRLSAASTETVSVSYSTLNGSAKSTEDYVPAVGSLTFAPGETEKTVSVTIVGDTLHELTETITLQLSSPSGATILDGTATGTITDNDVDTSPSTLPAITIEDYSTAEGNVDETHMRFVLTLSKASTQTITVAYSTLDVTGTGGTDYEVLSGVVTFAPGETRQTIHAHIYGDTVVEATETYKVVLSSPTNATIADGEAIITIQDDDTPTLPTLSIADATVTEGNSGTKTVSVTVTLSAASSSAVTVNYATANGTATAGSDYTAKSGTLTFAAGETTKTFSITVAGDTRVESAETLLVNLTGATGATIADPQAVVTIKDNDALPTLSIADATVTEGDSGTKTVKMTVTLSKASSSAVTVNYATADGTATAGSDYTARSGTLTFAAGETTKTFSITVAGDTRVESAETLLVNLTGATGATIADPQAVVTIKDNDALPTLSIADATVTEGDSGTKTVKMTVTLSKASSSAVTVNYATGDGTATAGSDYTAKSGTLTFAAGETTKTFSITVAGDTRVESAETLLVNLTGATGATIADPQAVVTITNDDTAPTSTQSVTYMVNDNWGAGFTAAMTVVAGATALTGWTVEFDADFEITNIWNAKIVSHVGTHYVLQNMSYNAAVAAGANTAFGFQASAGTTTAISGVTINGTAVSDVPVMTVSGASVTEGSSGSSTLDFTVKLSKAATEAVTVSYATANGTATAGSDYTAKTGTLTFAPGETSKTVSVAVAGDTTVESNETLTLNLSGLSGGATLGTTTATGTIVNDDSLPTLSVSSASVTEGNGGTATMNFVVTLSQAQTGAVTVAYATENGTATAGSDYTAKSGSLTFAAGETSKTVSVSVLGDAVAEANETLQLKLSAASGATIATGSGTGTIVNDDGAVPLPAITIADTSVVEGNTGSGGGWLSTSGNQIVDAAGNTVQIAGVNWFGFEGTNMSPNGLWTRGYKEMMQQMLDEGFNTIRLPFSSDMLHATGTALGIDYSKNSDLAGLTPLQVMDKILAYAEEIGIRIILDHHRSDAGAGTSSNGLWYDSTHSEADWIADWQMLAERYADNTAVIGADLHNEPYNGTWGGGGANDWAAAAERAGNAIGAVNGNWLIFVEGVATYKGENYWWGGNLMGVRDRPIELDLDNKLVYSAHDYPNSIYEQAWFKAADFPANLPGIFDKMWGYIYKEGIAPVYIGEFGTKLTEAKDIAWYEAITSYLAGDFDNDGDIDLAEGDQGISWTYWSWNPNSGDTGGILKDDWKTVNENKMVYLEPIQFEFPDDAVTAYAEFTVTLSAAATSTVTVDYMTLVGGATLTDFAASTGTITFGVGEQTKVVRVAILGDLVDEANEGFTVMLSNPVNATVADSSATATIIDDDGLTAAGTGILLVGTALADSLAGGSGDDILTGGAGADHFVFNSKTGGQDRITDFNELSGGAEQGDLLEFEGLLVGTFSYRGSAAFTGGGDNTEARVSGENVLVDVDGDGTADLTITLTGLTSSTQLSDKDFLFS